MYLPCSEVSLPPLMRQSLAHRLHVLALVMTLVSPSSYKGPHQSIFFRQCPSNRIHYLATMAICPKRLKFPGQNLHDHFPILSEPRL